jgi:hypothetical protein
MANREKLKSLIDVAGVGLEIGPSFDPVVAKRDGHQVEVLDHLSAADLRRKYQDAPNVDLSRIEDVDYVSDGGSILELIGKRGYYDYIVASHVIEHTVDLLGFLSDCQQLLKPSGVLALAIPDTRFSFDCLRPVSSTGQVLQAHLDKGKRHGVGKVFDELAHNCLRDGAIAWASGSNGPLTFFRPLSQAKAIMELYQQGDMFLDIHAWQFTPSSFRLIVGDLFALELIELREQFFEDSNEREFFVAMSQQADGCQVSRIELAQRTILEQRAIITNPTPA